jgi:hypothetical protein
VARGGRLPALTDARGRRWDRQGLHFAWRLAILGVAISRLRVVLAAARAWHRLRRYRVSLPATGGPQCNSDLLRQLGQGLAISNGRVQGLLLQDVNADRWGSGALRGRSFLILRCVRHRHGCFVSLRRRAGQGCANGVCRIAAHAQSRQRGAQARPGIVCTGGGWRVRGRGRRIGSALLRTQPSGIRGLHCKQQFGRCEAGILALCLWVGMTVGLISINGPAAGFHGTVLSRVRRRLLVFRTPAL